MAYVDQLIEIHGKLQSGKGRRHEQEALHRAGVVLVVAGWESYVERLLAEAFSKIEAAALPAAGAPPAPPWARQVILIRKTEINSDIKRFNTPDATGVRDLFGKVLGFDTWTIWSWTGRRTWNAEEMRKRLNCWLQIRHTVAHGVSLPTDIEWIKGESGKARLTLSLLEECKKFLRM